MHKEKVCIQRVKKPSMQVSGVVITRMQQLVQHLSKSGGMAGTTADKERNGKDRHSATIHGARMSEKINPEKKKSVYEKGMLALPGPLLRL